MPSDWLAYVKEPPSEAEQAALRRAVARGSPFGEESWAVATAKKLGLLSTLRARGRPRLGKPLPG
jgi:putative transposase